MNWLKATPDGMIGKLCEAEGYLSVEYGRIEFSYGNVVIRLSREKSEEVANETLIQLGKMKRSL